MSFPNLSSRTTKLIYPSFQDDLDQTPWDSHPQDDDANYEQLYKRVPSRTNPNKMFTQEKKGLSYIDKSISLCAPNDPAVLNNKLQKFFKTLTKNYKPVTPRSKEKSSRDTHMTSRREEGYSPSKYIQNRGSPLMMKKGLSQGQKPYSQGIIDNERPLSSNEDEEELIMVRGGMENMYGKFAAQEPRYNDARDYRQYGNNVNMNMSSSMRSLSNPTRQSQEEKMMMDLSGRNMTRMSNMSTQDHSELPCFNQGSVEDNCNYAYLKSFQKETEGTHPYQRFLVQQESPQEDPNFDLRGYNPVYIPRRNGAQEIVSQSQSSSLKNLDPNQLNQHSNANYNKKSSKTDNRKKEVYSSQGSPLINYNFSERDDECEPYRPSIAMPGVAGVYSSMLSDSKDENPNYTDVKLIGSHQVMSNNEIRNEQMLSFAKKASNFGNTLQQSSEDNKLRTMSQVTDLLDSTEDMFIKQKGCFNMFLALNKIVFKRINSMFQDIKRGPLQLQEVSHGNFVSFGEATKHESIGLSQALDRYQKENNQGLNMILQGFAKISGMVNAIEIATNRTKQSGLERIANHGTVNQVVYKDRFITGFYLLFAIEKSQRRASILQSFNTWSTNFKMEKLREAEATKFQQIVQILSQEKQKLQDELNSAREKSSPVVKNNPPQKELKFFLQSMEAPGGPLKLRKDSNDSKPSSTNTTLTNRQEEVPVKNAWAERSPLASRLQISNKASESQDLVKMFNGAIKQAFEHDSSKHVRSRSMIGNEFVNSAQKNMQENQNRQVDTRRNEPENCFSPPQNYIDTLKRQSKGNYEKILSPSSQNCYESRGSRGIELESSKGSRGDLNQRNHLGRAVLGFGVSPPKELTEEDEFTAESIRKGETVKVVQREFFESMERFDHANVDDTYSHDVDHQRKDSMTLDQSEIMRERTGDTRSIRDILARGLITRNFDESMMGSDGEQSFYKNGMENVMILKREGI